MGCAARVRTTTHEEHARHGLPPSMLPQPAPARPAGALLSRLRGTRAWLGVLVGALVADGRAAGLRRPVRLRLVDATTVSRPGSTGVDWRVHLSLNLAPWAVDGLELTDGRGAEAL